MSANAPLILSVSLTPNPVTCGSSLKISVLVEETTYARLEKFTHAELTDYTHNNLAVDPLD